MTEIDSF